ncbi:MAG: DUF5050 domain-containing protein [Clostridia bacterium]|nr:DUF5050 domain-containing protein [Clostridia bacterium]
MKKIKIKYCLIVSASLLLAATIFLIFYFNRSVVVPQISGKNITTATKILNEAGLKAKTLYEYNDTVLKDIVISQNIEVGSDVKYNTSITIIVSKGIEQITLPDVKNSSLEDANDTLKKLGFSVVTEEQFSKTITEGNVIAQSVLAGEQADKGSTIKLIISKGRDLVEVPNIKGMSLKKAEQTLKNADLYLQTENKIQFSNTIKEGYIISQDIKEHDQTDRYSAINVVISAGVANKAGTTTSNANRFGKVTTQGNWVYFAGSDSAIYRMRKDRSELQLICNYSAVSLNVVGEWIYFVDGTVGGIHKVRIDGTGKTKISNVTSYKVYVDGDWIYYTDQYWGGKLYRMKSDGSSVKQITSKQCRDYIINKGYVYFTESSEGIVYKCKIDGTGETMLCAGFVGNYLTLAGNKLVVVSNNENIFSVNLNGSGYHSFQTNNTQYAFLNGYDGWVYYLEHDFRYGSDVISSFGRMRFDGSQKTKIYEYNYLNHADGFINVVDGWIYFQNEHENDNLYRVKIDGTKIERMG